MTSQPDPERQTRRAFAELLVLDGRLAEACPELASADAAEIGTLVAWSKELLRRTGDGRP
jgi:hypothetical protein